MLRQVVLGVLALVFLLLFYQLRLVDKEHDNGRCRRHNACHNGEQREEADIGLALYMVQEGGDQQIQDTAHRAHQIDDGVGLGAQRLGGDIRHQGHGRAAIGAHGNQQQAQHADKQGNLAAAGGCVVAVGKQGQQKHQADGGQSTEQDKGAAAAQAGGASVGQPAEQRQQEQSHHIVRCHDGTGNGLVQVKGVRQNQGNQIVIHLPEGTDGQESEAHQDCALGVEFHEMSSLLGTP